jgi:hypothetical protein
MIMLDFLQPTTAFRQCDTSALPAVPPPVLAIGRVLCSRSAATLLERHHMSMEPILNRFRSGDFGLVDQATAAQNQCYDSKSGRLVAVYRVLDPAVLPYLDAEARRCAPSVVVVTEQLVTRVFVLRDV